MSLTMDEKIKDAIIALSGKKGSLTRLYTKVTSEMDLDTTLVDPSPENIETVQEMIDKLRSANDLVTNCVEHLEGLYEYLKDNDNIDVDARLDSLHGTAHKYTKTYEDALKIMRRIQRAQNPVTIAKESATTSSKHNDQKRWKPRDEYKPSTLSLADRPKALDTWASKLKSYIPDANEHAFQDVFNLIDNLVSDEVKNKIQFNREEEIKIFGTGSLIEKLKNLWQREYPVNRLRISMLEEKSGDNENWDTWEARMSEEAAKANMAVMTGVQITNLLIIMNYRGPHSQKIKSELAKAAKSSEDEISLVSARETFHSEAYASKLCSSNTVKKVNYQGGKSNNRGPKPYSGNSNGKSQGPTSGGKPRFSLANHPHCISMKAQKRCYSCYKENCPATAGAGTPCPSRPSLACSFCLQKGDSYKGHIDAACTKKWNAVNGTPSSSMGNSIRTLYNEEVLNDQEAA